MLYSEGEVRLARTVVRVPESEKWNKDKLAAIRSTPLSMHQPREPEVVFKEKANVEQSEFVDKLQLARQVYLKAAGFEEFGLTCGCPKCEHFRRHDAWGMRPHSNICRERIVAELSKTAVGRLRVGNAAERLDRTVEALGQQHRHDLPQGEDAGVVVQPRPEVVVEQGPSDFQPEFLPMDHDESGRCPSC